MDSQRILGFDVMLYKVCLSHLAVREIFLYGIFPQLAADDCRGQSDEDDPNDHRTETDELTKPSDCIKIAIT